MSQNGDLLIHEAVEDEDEDALKTVENGEEVSHDDRLSVDIEQTKRPRWTKQHDQHHGAFDPRPATSSITHAQPVLVLISVKRGKNKNFFK